MRVLILPGTYDLANLGDFAMLQVAVDRLGRLLPSPEFHILSYDSPVMSEAFPAARVIPAHGRDLWLDARVFPRWFARGPAAAWRRRNPAAFRRLWTLKAGVLRGRYLMALDFLKALDRVHVLVMTGCGLIADPFRAGALRALDTLALAGERGIPIVLLSQGIGPLEEPALRQRAAAVLPRAALVGVREDQFSPRLLRDLGVDSDRIVVTGDDGLALAVPEPLVTTRRCIGVNVRVASYSGINPATVEMIRQSLTSTAQELQAELLGLPIAIGDYDSDVAALARLLEPLTQPARQSACRTPVDCVRRASQCRTVVAGSYHAGVFALAQGVPVVGLAATTYYRQKFEGLAAFFGDGCCILSPGQPDFSGQLGAAVARFWRNSENLRPSLRARAAELVARAEGLYRRIPAVVAGDPS
jgi:colanic acid/amylovoran biosynthesis protein